MLSLPRVLKTTAETIPNHTPYLTTATNIPEPLPNSGKPLKIAIAWTGSPEHALNVLRSVPLAEFSTLFDLDADFYALQPKGTLDPAWHEVTKGRKNTHWLGPSVHNFTDTAAHLNQMDLVLTIDTSLVHLAGAMGKKLFVLLHSLPDWRWFLNRNDSPWYPTARLFRQPQFRDWQPTLMQVKQELQKLIESKSSPHGTR